MTKETFESLINECEPPFVIKTRGGRDYRLTDRQSFWLPPRWRHTVIVAQPGEGIAFLDIASIDSVEVEHEGASRR
jgi:hypothetical protein